MEIATMYFTGRAYKWKECYFIDKQNVKWEELVEAICRRFDGNSMKQLVKEFNKLVQAGTVKKYSKRFEDLRARMLYHNPILTEQYFIESYIVD